MGFCIVAQKFDLLKRNDKQLCVMSKLERIEPLAITSKTGKLAQALRPDLVMPAFLSWG